MKQQQALKSWFHPQRLCNDLHMEPHHSGCGASLGTDVVCSRQMRRKVFMHKTLTTVTDTTVCQLLPQRFQQRKSTLLFWQECLQYSTWMCLFVCYFAYRMFYAPLFNSWKNSLLKVRIKSKVTLLISIYVEIVINNVSGHVNSFVLRVCNQISQPSLPQNDFASRLVTWNAFRAGL